MDNLKDLEQFLKESVNDKWICVELRLIGFEDDAVPDELLEEIKTTPFAELYRRLNICEVVFSFDGYYHSAKRLTSVELAAIRDLSALLRAVTREAIFSLAAAAFLAR